MRRLGFLVLTAVLFFGSGGPGRAGVTQEFRSQTSLGVRTADTLSQITGIAISPLLGMGALGAYKYYRTPEIERARLPWYAQPWFFSAALLVVGLCMAKDAAGPAVPTALKKPLNLLELFENKASALLATGVIVPLALELFEHLKAVDSTELDFAGAHLAAANLHVLGGLIAVPFALAIYAVVWLVSHTINVLVLISPFTTVDAALKSLRAGILGTVVGAGALDDRLGAGWAIVVVLICVLLAPWAFRTVVFGTVFAWDLVTFRRRRFVPERSGNWMFSARPIGTAPSRAFGLLRTTAIGGLEFVWRPWLVFPARVEPLPEGRYWVGRGLIHSQILRQEGDRPADVFNLPPRCSSHEDAIARVYEMDGVRPVGLRAAWAWLKGLFRSGPSLQSVGSPGNRTPAFD
ncbi:MAG: hypothetical protein KF791_08075 [Verrucomicrobiae bacterium]|nr:hypothetical protein [Verrucomicrobiae bacterium]